MTQDEYIEYWKCMSSDELMVRCGLYMERITKLEAELTQTKAILTGVQDQRDEAYRQRAAANAVVDAAIEWRKRCGEGEPNAFAQAALVEAIDAAISGPIPQDSVLFQCPECKSITTDMADVKALQQAYNQLQAAQQWQPVDGLIKKDSDYVVSDAYRGLITVHAQYHSIQAALPDDIRLCRKVQP